MSAHILMLDLVENVMLVETIWSGLGGGVVFPSEKC